MNSGIYAILNTSNDKYYIGSASNFADRWRLHLLDLNRNKYHNRHLQASWNTYGKDSFLFVVLEYTLDLDEREQHWINELNAVDRHFGYNICMFLRNRTGVKASEETRKKLSESHKGHKHSEETKRKMSEVHKGNKGRLGQKLSKSHNAALQKGRENYKYSDEVKSKIAASNRGQKRSVESRLKMSVAAKNRRIRERELAKPLDYTCDMWV